MVTGPAVLDRIHQRLEHAHSLSSYWAQFSPLFFANASGRPSEIEKLMRWAGRTSTAAEG